MTGRKGHQRRTEKRACTNVAHKYIGTLMLWVLSNFFFCSVVHVLIRPARRATTQITGEQKKKAESLHRKGGNKNRETCMHKCGTQMHTQGSDTNGREAKKKNIASERGHQRRTEKRAQTNAAHIYIPCVVLAFLSSIVRANKRSTQHTTFSPMCGEKRLHKAQL